MGSYGGAMDDRLVIPLGIMHLSAERSVATMIGIQGFLRRRGRKVHPLLLRIMIFRCVSEDRCITQEEISHARALYHKYSFANLLMSAPAVYPRSTSTFDLSTRYLLGEGQPR